MAWTSSPVGMAAGCRRGDRGPSREIRRCGLPRWARKAKRFLSPHASSPWLTCSTRLLRSDRTKKPMAVEESLAILRQGAGKHFDPGLVARFATVAGPCTRALGTTTRRRVRELARIIERYFRPTWGLYLRRLLQSGSEAASPLCNFLRKYAVHAAPLRCSNKGSTSQQQLHCASGDSGEAPQATDSALPAKCTRARQGRTIFRRNAIE
jgi:hypothetical protein